MRYIPPQLLSHIRASLLCTACSMPGLLAACDMQELPIAQAPLSRAHLQQFVTGEAAQSLSSRGEFEIAGPPASDIPMISRERAGELALAFVRTWGRFYERDWTRQHGAPIHLDNLEVDPRIHYAETPFGRFPDGYHPAFRRAFGPWYLVQLTSGEVPALVVAVSAYNTDQKIDRVGRLIPPRLGGNDFEAMAVARGRSGFRPNTPEEAVAQVGQRTGARTNRTPELVLLYVGGHPANAASAVWKLSLDRPIPVRTVRGARQARVWEVFVGSRSQLYIAAPEHTSTIVTTAIRYDSQGGRVGPETVHVPVKPGATVSLEEVTLAEEQ